MYILSNKIIFGKHIKTENDKVIIRCYEGFDNIKERSFNKELFAQGIVPSYVLIGIRTDKGISKINVVDAGVWSEYLLKKYSKGYGT